MLILIYLCSDVKKDRNRNRLRIVVNHMILDRFRIQSSTNMHTYYDSGFEFDLIWIRNM